MDLFYGRSEKIVSSSNFVRFLAMKPTVSKYTDWKEVPQNDAAFWRTQTPLERLAAALMLNRFARQLQKAALDGRNLPEIPRIIKRTRG
jgi:hypothetical protein